VVLAMGLASVPAAAKSNDGQSAAETQALKNYRFATAAGRHAEATKYVLDYMEQSEGENAPLTVALTQRYGNLLRKEGDIREKPSPSLRRPANGGLLPSGSMVLSSLR
jgi:hypothetical protein